MPESAFKPWLESPLHRFALRDEAEPRRADSRVWGNEAPNLGYALLRGDGAEAGFLELTARITGLEPPRRPKALSQGEGGALLWLSPDEWLLISSRQRLAGWLPALERGFAERRVFAQALDVSGGFTAVYLCGEPHLAVLRHLGAYDFEALRAGQCVGTLLGKAAVQVLRLDGDGVFVVCRRSFADYVWLLLRRAARPYGFAVCELPADAGHPLWAQLAQAAPAAALAGSVYGL
ncbi:MULTISPECIES: sarcosine oxidase subunit gamma [Chromobacterium]|uniref:Sarcosine oxidase subunit gamma n=1 Tax=Chromobacterium rhizoryzae TaxID=1778675 RepID=A0AAD0RQP2_9NEIS|nr:MULTISPECIES: sarcosine oxidase subunit gamma family protein [Chromobacterium]AXT46038.1 sarcosine oxidase subunit gamma [Chromobacterium rhizoryzae]PTU69577.1 sarcosine oxidase subunit gamma [Chromobacterium haemolyticum]